MLRRLAPLALLIALAVGGAGCAADPVVSEPSPRFTTDADAFAAAEETYRAYVDALNERRADSNSLKDPQSFLVSDALEVDIDTQRQLRQSGLTITGATVVAEVVPVQNAASADSQTLLACLDSSATVVWDDAGVDVTPAARQERTLLRVKLSWVGAEFLIVDSSTEDATSC